jgi:hypothetical protein
VDERTRLFLCVLGAAAFFALLLGLFGALTGAVNWSSGRAGGTALGLGARRAFARLAERPLSPAGEGALVGGVDGAAFGAVVGLVVGLIAGWSFPAEWLVLRPVLLTATVLVVAAVLFGLLAGGLAVVGPRVVAGLFVGAMAGALGGYAVAAVDGLFFGTLAGAAAGAAAARLWR